MLVKPFYIYCSQQITTERRRKQNKAKKSGDMLHGTNEKKASAKTIFYREKPMQ